MEDRVIQVFENDQFRVHGYLDKCANAWLDVEDTARGLGFIEKEKISSRGEKYIRWERLNRYVDEIKANSKSPLIEKISTPLRKGDYIPENLVYRLAMKANNETAEKFQAWIADEVIPAIRKNGYYISPNAAVDSAAEPLDMEKIHCLLKCAELTNLDRLRNQILREVVLILTGVKF